ncbi:SCO2322 family protein [Streptomyces sp. A5-4]|uniref:SCO2322 family protein n=1 Tax=Streptomyces sp. A5-4 TaxID=3384771 RepID=UPI003DA89421
MRTRTRPVALLLALCAALVVLGGAGSAQAATGYRYWSFWDQDGGGKWAYATQGPSTARPADGDVQGFRFAVSQDSQDAAKPRGAGDFRAICGATPAQGDAKRVALVIDFGTAADAPDGERPPAPRTACARIRQDATSAEALAAVAKPLRYNSDALLCAISGYPKAGCGDQVAAADGRKTAPATENTPDEGGPSAGILVGLAAVLALGAAGVWQGRRRRGRP